MKTALPVTKALILEDPKAKNYRKSCLVDADSGLPIMLPVTKASRAAAKAGARDGRALRKALAAS